MNKKGSVRIIGGMWKRSPLIVLDSEGLRPTGDRQRETLFNWLEHLTGGFEGKNSLDLFAGTGALSFEWMSRGGKSALLIEKSHDVAAVIKQNIQKFSADKTMRVIEGDCLYQNLKPNGFDVVFIDPPFKENLQLNALKFALPLLAAQGLIYVESPSEIGDETLETLKLTAVRRLKAGASHMLLTQPKEDPS